MKINIYMKGMLGWFVEVLVQAADGEWEFMKETGPYLTKAEAEMHASTEV